MASKSRINIPEAGAALDNMKYEVARELGVNLKQGYNGDLTSKQAGSIGGQMVNVICPIRKTKTHTYVRKNRTKKSHQQKVTYQWSIQIS